MEFLFFVGFCLVAVLCYLLVDKVISLKYPKKNEYEIRQCYADSRLFVVEKKGKLGSTTVGIYKTIEEAEKTIEANNKLNE